MQFRFFFFGSQWRLLNFKKLLFFPHILSRREKFTYLALAILGIACGIAATTGFYIYLTVPVPTTGGTYREGMLKEPRITNPLFATQDVDRDLSRLIYSGLITYDGTGRAIPDLAERYEISKDAKTYTFFLNDALWHDGKKVTADDVVFTIKTIQNPAYKSVLRANWQGVEVEALNEKTVQFTLRSPYAPFLENLTVGILPKHLWANIGSEQILLHELNLKPVGSGPYKFDKFSQENNGTLVWYQLSRNTSYYREGPYIKKIIFYFFKNEDDLVHALRKDAIDGYGPASTDVLTELNAQKKNVYAASMPRVFGLFFNQKKNNALADKAVRLAISYAVNKAEIAQKTGASGAAAIDTPLPFITTATPASGYNPDSAKKILDEAGWKDGDGDGIREKTTKEKKKITTSPLRFTLATSDWPDLAQTAELIKEELKKVGIDINIEKRDLSELESSVIRPRNFDILLFGELYGFEGDPFAFWHSSQIKDPGLNVAQYVNPTVDRLLEEARRTTDNEIREKKYQDFGVQFSKDIPAVFLYTQLYHYILPGAIKGVQIEKISLPADRFNTINKWHLNTGRSFGK